MKSAGYVVRDLCGLARAVYIPGAERRLTLQVIGPLTSHGPINAIYDSTDGFIGGTPILLQFPDEVLIPVFAHEYAHKCRGDMNAPLTLDEILAKEIRTDALASSWVGRRQMRDALRYVRRIVEPLGGGCDHLDTRCALLVP